MDYFHPLKYRNHDYYADTVNKFGRAAATVTGDDIWTGSSVYPFPAAAATTTVVSDSVEDDADKEPAGTGAYTVEVQGLDTNYNLTVQAVTMNGAGAVTLSTDLLRVFRIKAITSGSGGTNDGNIDVLHGATVLATMEASLGQTFMAIYTVPADYDYANLYQTYSGIARQTSAASADIAMQLRPVGESWQTKKIWPLSTVGTSFIPYMEPFPYRIEPKTDIRMRCVYASTSISTAAGFDLLNITE